MNIILKNKLESAIMINFIMIIINFCMREIKTKNILINLENAINFLMIVVQLEKVLIL